MGFPLRSGSILLFGVGLAVVLGLGTPAARADDVIQTASPASVKASKIYHAHHSAAAKSKAGHKIARRSDPHRYFVEFRARNAASYGHMYVLYGQVNSREEIVESHIAGFFPAGDTRNCVNCSVFNWTIGHLIFVPSELGASAGALEEKYVLYRYRVWVTKDEYDRVVAYIKDKEAHKPLWNALWKNCVDFGRDVAEYMHLNVPFFIWMEPKDFVRALAFANGVKKEQLPLKDAASGLRKAVYSASRRRPLPPHRPAAKQSSVPQKAAVKQRQKPKKQPVAAVKSKTEAIASTATH